VPEHLLRIGDHRSCGNGEEFLSLNPVCDSVRGRAIEKEVGNSFFILDPNFTVKGSPWQVAIGKNYPRSGTGPVPGKFEGHPRCPSRLGGLGVGQKEDDLPGPRDGGGKIRRDLEAFGAQNQDT
jgi:hypothetical protein